MNRATLTIIAIAALAGAGIAVAQTADPKMMDHSKMRHTMGAPLMGADASPAAKAFAESNARMHKDMTMAITGDADVDFIKGMPPHHQGAVDMAKIVLQYGTGSEVKVQST